MKNGRLVTTLYYKGVELEVEPSDIIKIFSNDKISESFGVKPTDEIKKMIVECK